MDIMQVLGREMFFILVDAYSKWLEVVPMSSANSSATIEVFSSTDGLPKVLVADNGAQFTSADFHSLENNCIRHLHFPPYHPSQQFGRACHTNF